MMHFVYGSLRLAGLGAVVVYLVQRFRRRAVDPDGQDPARHLALLLLWGCPLLVVEVVVGNIVVLNLAGIAALLPLLVGNVVLLLGILALAA
jgi:1,6-anhydro-N-acetylmuramate kinase